MRILFLCNYYPPQHFGGYEELCQDVAIGLRERGHQVTVLTTRPRSVAAAAAPDETDVVRALEPEVAIGHLLATPRLILGRARRTSHNRQTLVQTISRGQPDLAVVWAMWNLSPDIAAGLEASLGGHVLYYIADYWPTLPDAVSQHLSAPSKRLLSRLAKRGLARWIGRSAGRMANGLQLAQVACVSQAVLDALQAARIPMGKESVIHNGIDPAQFHPAAPTPKARPLRLLLAGRLSEDKGVFVALDAVALARDAGHDIRLSLVGAGDPVLEAALRERIALAGLQDRVCWLGRRPREEMPKVMAEHDVLLVPSLWPDPLPRSAQEGMACGLAVIASRLGGLPELIDDGRTGILVPPGNASALAEAVGRLARHPNLCQAMAAAGRKRVQSAFAIDQTIDRIERRLLEMTTP